MIASYSALATDDVGVDLAGLLPSPTRRTTPTPNGEGSPVIG